MILPESATEPNATSVTMQHPDAGHHPRTSSDVGSCVEFYDLTVFPFLIPPSGEGRVSVLCGWRARCYRRVRRLPVRYRNWKLSRELASGAMPVAPEPFGLPQNYGPLELLGPPW